MSAKSPGGARADAIRTSLLVTLAYLFFALLWGIARNKIQPYFEPPYSAWDDPTWIEAATYLAATSVLLFAFVHRLVTAIDRHHQEALKAKLDLVNRLALAAEFRDGMRNGHNMRIGQGSGIVARKLGLPEATAELFSQAAMLHDIGKIGIPDSVLSKTGPLTREERTVMQKHTEYGWSLLDGSDLEVLKVAQSIALTHHERWDGSGYPHGLAGEDIPLEGRIVAVCDVFDALTSERTYKRAWTVDEARAYLEEQAGRLFDPHVVAAFVGSLDDILALGTSSGTNGSSADLAAAAVPESQRDRYSVIGG
jgi:putative two-component system response regulator